MVMDRTNLDGGTHTHTQSKNCNSYVSLYRKRARQKVRLPDLQFCTKYIALTIYKLPFSFINIIQLYRELPCELKFMLGQEIQEISNPE